MKEASSEVGMYIIENLAPQNIGIATTEIVSIYVSVAELLVLPFGVMFLLPVCTCCGSPKSDDVSIGGSGLSMPEKLRRSRLHHVYISSLLFPTTTYNYFRFASAVLNLQVHELYDMADVGTTEKMRTKITGISSLAGTEPQILLGVIYPPPPLATYVLKNTLAIGGLRERDG